MVTYSLDLIRLILAIFATYRLARGLSVDVIGSRIREGIGRKAAVASDHSFTWYVAELVNCPYCTGFWFAGIVTLLILFPTAYGDLLLIWFGIAGAQTFLEGCRDNR